MQKTEQENKDTAYKLILEQVRYQLQGETHVIANLANAAAVLFNSLDEINWAGFYLYEHGELVLGPFQGKPATVHIPIGEGVCGTAAQQRQSIRVADVHQFPGHIACDLASQSEIVIPLIKNEQLLGVLDIDSPRLQRFDEKDQFYLEQFVQIVLAAIA
jgi:L-methionine (R)-S-oxide reductase